MVTGQASARDLSSTSAACGSQDPQAIVPDLDELPDLRQSVPGVGLAGMEGAQ